MKQQLELIRQQALEALDAAADAQELDSIRVKYLGKKGELTAVLKMMGKLSPEERPIIGQVANEVREALTDAITVVSAVSHHDESTGGAMDPVSAALILADKSDVRRNRVRTQEKAKFDIHDRVNYAVTGHNLKVDAEAKKISLNLQVDENICTMFEYFDIFLGRMMMCRSAAEMLGAKFRLTVNGGKVL